ncbi:MAG: 50S ribosomal protein L20 [Anaerolineaceae bacterium 4572_78]|nr:MAG: 50S ribosomal protein L20 [Anaerolineaceae bacterium 4572_78]
MRVKGGTTTHRRHKKVLKFTRGQSAGRNRLYRTANEAMMKSLVYAYRDRRNRKRAFRRLWIIRISAAANEHGMNYSTFMHGLKLANVDLNRKVLSEIAISDREAFAKLVDMAKLSLS